jgi:hypothetical protein
MKTHFLFERDLPDAGNGICCMGNAARGPGGCTCWEPVYDLEQEPVQHGPLAVRKRMCGDCAFRKGSPEQLGDERHAHSGEGELDGMVLTDGALFICHQGMRRVVALVHKPTGVRVEQPACAYAPPMGKGGAWKANGALGDICAGFMAARAKEPAP